ncbi:Hypothetical predicted protein [Olea europaea subsp. europaea]|uniref:Uncharacterized protein n=1 Tax=Olea europaea subsp. europaea TaxID=158383 RepID=A0A8S0VDF3_OLEEU|nr:Hypothetical predicted protein [Olea europaea subsp. europaea]
MAYDAGGFGYYPETMENPRYGKFKDNDNTEIYHKYSRLFGDDPNETLPINAETTNSSNDPTLGRASFSMNISLRRSGEKLKGKHAKGKWKKFRAREVSESVDNLAYASREMASVIRAKEDGLQLKCRRCATSGSHIVLNATKCWVLGVADCASTEMTYTSGSHTSSETDCDLVSNSCSDDESDEDVLQQLETNMVVWLQYYRIAERMPHRPKKQNGSDPATTAFVLLVGDDGDIVAHVYRGVIVPRQPAVVSDEERHERQRKQTLVLGHDGDTVTHGVLQQRHRLHRVTRLRWSPMMSYVRDKSTVEREGELK